MTKPKKVPIKKKDIIKDKPFALGDFVHKVTNTKTKKIKNT